MNEEINQNTRFRNFLFSLFTHLLVATLASFVTFFVLNSSLMNKNEAAKTVAPVSIPTSLSTPTLAASPTVFITPTYSPKVPLKANWKRFTHNDGGFTIQVPSEADITTCDRPKDPTDTVSIASETIFITFNGKKHDCAAYPSANLQISFMSKIKYDDWIHWLKENNRQISNTIVNNQYNAIDVNMFQCPGHLPNQFDEEDCFPMVGGHSRDFTIAYKPKTSTHYNEFDYISFSYEENQTATSIINSLELF